MGDTVQTEQRAGADNHDDFPECGSLRERGKDGHHRRGENEARHAVTRRVQGERQDEQQKDAGQRAGEPVTVTERDQLRHAGEHKQNIQGIPGLLMPERQPERRLGDERPHPHPRGPGLQRCRTVAEVPRPDDDKHREHHPAQRIQFR